MLALIIYFANRIDKLTHIIEIRFLFEFFCSLAIKKSELQDENFVAFGPKLVTILHLHETLSFKRIFRHK